MGYRRRSTLIAAAALVVALAACTPPPAPDATTEAPVGVGDRAAHTATALSGGGVLVAGGCVVDGCATATASAAIVRGDAATATGSMHVARDAHTATVLPSGQVLVAGGFSGEGRPPESSAEFFDPSSGEWAMAGPLSVGRGGHTAAALGDGRVAVAGGWVSSRTYTDTIEVFDPSTGAFSFAAPLPEAVDGLASIALPDGSVLVTGGQSSPGVASALSVLIHPDGSVEPTVGALLEARFKHTMVLLDDGRVLVLGGTSDDRQLLATTEFFDPATGAYAPGPTLGAGRYKLSGAAAVLPDGQVIVGGGGPGVELIDPATGTVTSLDVLSGVSSFGTITAADGLVYFIGGYDESIGLRGTFLVTQP